MQDTASLWQLLATCRMGKLRERWFVYDGRMTQRAVTHIPVQEIDEGTYELFVRLRERGPCTREQLQGVCRSAEEASAIPTMIAAGYLAPVGRGGPGVEEAGAGASTSTYDASRRARRFLVPPRFFNVPEFSRDAEVDVALVGFPFAAHDHTWKTATFPQVLRGVTRQLNWFEVFSEGVLSMTGRNGHTAAALCRGVTLADWGDIRTDVRNVDELFAQVRGHFSARRASQVPRLFIGGDHSVTFPIVDALSEEFEDICVVHLDAHHDLTYGQVVDLNHHSVMRNLLLHTRVPKILSLGIRPVAGSGMGAYRALGDAADRVKLVSLIETKRAIMQPELLRQLTAELAGRPCYLTIDADVLSEHLLGGSVTTPASDGLGWDELLHLVGSLVETLKVVSADVVEFQDVPTCHLSSFYLRTLLLVLIEGLAAHAARG